ncbi:MAG: SDR family oxidoreductase [Gammaproteobacteria bacterium]|nr:SDR family oxidoreductase [Gammaproteobacteria bacterium]
MKDFERVMQVNCYGFVHDVPGGDPHLLKARDLLSIWLPSAALGAHAWTAAFVLKGAVLALTRCIANEYSLQRLNCNAICPGGIDTPMVGWRQAPDNIDARLLNKAMLPDWLLCPRVGYCQCRSIFSVETPIISMASISASDGGLMS